jgi:hypothetical protein
MNVGVGGRDMEDKEGNILVENGRNYMRNWREEIQNCLGLDGVLKRWFSGQIGTSCFLCPLREWMKGFHAMLRQRLSFLLMLFGCSLISVAFLITWSMYLGFTERMVDF